MTSCPGCGAPFESPCRHCGARQKPKSRFYLDENNSGGYWWLDRRQYDALKAAGWKLDHKSAADHGHELDTDDVPWAYRSNWYVEADSLGAAIESFGKATGADYYDGGCSCCGQPFYIGTRYEAGK